MEHKGYMWRAHWLKKGILKRNLSSFLSLHMLWTEYEKHCFTHAIYVILRPITTILCKPNTSTFMYIK